MNKNLIDSLEVIREIGKGGFGCVYLAKDEEGNFFALKKLFIESPKYAEKELKALDVYKKFIKNKSVGNIVDILDLKVSDNQVEYLMPLADGVNALSPLDENWKALSLKALIEQRYSKKELFTPDEIIEILEPIFEAVTQLNNNKIVHRDIKPENIIFINGKAHLADIGLISEDSYSVSSAGTPDYTPSSWYLESGGKADMWGLATTLYFALTGNSPDKMGRTAFMYPPFADNISTKQKEAWEHFHRVANRATLETAKERYLTFEAFAQAFKNIKGEDSVSNPIKAKATPIYKKISPNLATFALVCLLTAIFSFNLNNGLETFSELSLGLLYIASLWLLILQSRRLKSGLSLAFIIFFISIAIRSANKYFFFGSSILFGCLESLISLGLLGIFFLLEKKIQK